jgi:hypothetical protein
MAIPPATEESYIRALLVLGPKPRYPVCPSNSHYSSKEFLQREVDYYNATAEYMGEVAKYVASHLFIGPTSVHKYAVGWVDGFLRWQREEREGK